MAAVLPGNLVAGSDRHGTVDADRGLNEQVQPDAMDVDLFDLLELCGDRPVRVVFD